MILDNADNSDTFFAKNGSDNHRQEPIASYMPKTGNGKMFITSRNLNVVERLTGSHKPILRIPIMDTREALRIIGNKLNGGFDEDAAMDLVRVLDFIPLAVNQAAAYINRRAPRVSISSYLDDFRRSERQKSGLLHSDAGDIRRHESASNSVVLTWQVTFEQIRQERPTAANLLSLISFFHPQSIPEYLLSGYTEAAMESKNADDDRDDDFEDDLDILRAYSLISISTIPGFLDMHSLVQFCTQRWLSTFSDLSRWKSLFLRLASKHFPTGNFETWAACQNLLPHFQAVLREQPIDEVDILEWASLLANASWYMLTTGDCFEAETTAQKSLDARKRVLGADHRSTLTSMANLASAYRNQGQWEKAEKLEVHVMETHKTKLGADHPSTLTSMANLASTYRNQGQWEEAERLFMQVMETRKTKLGADHPSTLNSMANLALTYRNQGRLEEAEKLEVQVMETSKMKLGADHPDTLVSMANLATTYRHQGRLEEAEKLEVHVIEIGKTKLGPDHPSTLASMANLASTYRRQGRWEEAEKLVVHVGEIGKTKLGADHPSTLNSMANLASTYRNQGRLEEAEKLDVQVMETRKIKLRADHPSTLTSMANLASTYRDQGRLEEAEKLEVQVMETSKMKLGADHPETLAVMNNLAITWKRMGRREDALSLMDNCFNLRERVMGPRHPYTVLALRALEGWRLESREAID